MKAFDEFAPGHFTGCMGCACGFAPPCFLVFLALCCAMGFAGPVNIEVLLWVWLVWLGLLISRLARLSGEFCASDGGAPDGVEEGLVFVESVMFFGCEMLLAVCFSPSLFVAGFAACSAPTRSFIATWLFTEGRARQQQTG